MTDKKCPICGLWSTGNALLCDCGYNFEKGVMDEKKEEVPDWHLLDPNHLEKRLGNTSLVFIVIGCILFLCLGFSNLAYFGPSSAYEFNRVALIIFIVLIFISAFSSRVLYRKKNYIWAEIVSLIPVIGVALLIWRICAITAEF